MYREIPQERNFKITFDEYETLMFRMNNKVFTVRRNKDLLRYFPDYEAELSLAVTIEDVLDLTPVWSIDPREE